MAKRGRPLTEATPFEEIGKDGIIHTQTDLARYLGVSRKTVIEWRNSHNPPPKNGDQYLVAEIDEWYRERTKTISQGREKSKEKLDLDLEREKAKLKKEQAMAAISEFKANQLNPDFVPVIEVNQFLTSFFTELRRNTMAIPPEMCATYPPEVRELVQGDLNARLTMLLNYAADWVENWEYAEKEG